MCVESLSFSPSLPSLSPSLPPSLSPFFPLPPPSLPLSLFLSLSFSFQTVFLFTDGHVAQESFLELINNMLTSGMVPALFPDDEKEAVIGQVRDRGRERGRERERERERGRERRKKKR